jgi:hypothetical protein
MRVTEHRRKLEFADNMMRYLLDDLYTRKSSESVWW